MNIQQWQIIADAVIIGLMIAFGIYIRHLVAQQVASKDAAIEALTAALTERQITIDRLKEEAAPSVAAKYKQMKDHAELITTENVGLEGKLRETEEKLKRASRDTFTDVQRAFVSQVVELSSLVGEGNGVQEGVKVLLDRFSPLAKMGRPITPQEWLNYVRDVASGMGRIAEDRINRATVLGNDALKAAEQLKRIE